MRKSFTRCQVDLLLRPQPLRLAPTLRIRDLADSGRDCFAERDALITTSSETVLDREAASLFLGEVYSPEGALVLGSPR
jgi:hypothetical protein